MQAYDYISPKNQYKVCTLSAFCLFFILSLRAQGQKASDSAGKIPITILNNRTFEAIKTDSNSFFKFIGDVAFQHGTDFLYCDTAILNQEKNNLEAFGNVKIVQENGTTANSDYLSYTGNIKKAYLKGNVALNSGEDNLWTEELDYFLTSKTGNYYQNGTLQTGSTTVSSTKGTYNASTKEARFTEQVFVTDTAYNIESKDLGYNTENKMMRFFDTTIVSNESSVLRTSSGTYDSKNQIAHFDVRSSIWYQEQYIIGDSLDYNKVSGLGIAIGEVIIYDTTQKATLYCGRAIYNEKEKTLLALEKPVLKKSSEKDSIYTRADTFYGAHTIMHTDTVWHNKTIQVKGKKKKKEPDTTTIPYALYSLINTPDTTSPRYYSGYHHVRIFSDSLQGKCDSICFTGKDSIIMMMIDPVVWSRKSQITGDTIIAFIDSGQIQKILVPNEALVVSQSGPEKAGLFNQVQGRTLTAYMKNETLDLAIIKPNAECIYYPRDESEAYLGVSNVTSDIMKVFFSEGEIEKIFFEQNVKPTLYPLNKVSLDDMKLSRFQWLEELRPKTIFELFE